MKITIPFALTLALAQATTFLDLPEGSGIKAHLEKLKYEVLNHAHTVHNDIFDTWSYDELKAWIKYHGLVAQDQSEQSIDALRDAAKEHKELLADDVKDYLAKAHAAAKEQGQEYIAKGQDYYDAGSAKAQDAFERAAQKWSDSRLRDFLEARGVAINDALTRDNLIQLVDQYKDKAATVHKEYTGRYWFSGWSKADLADALQRAGESVEGTRDQLIDRLHELYKNQQEGFKEGADKGADAGKSALNVLGKWKDAAFDAWPAEEIKEYVEAFGDHVTGTKDELVNHAKLNYYYLVYGKYPPRSFFEYVTDAIGGVAERAKRFLGVSSGKFDL